MEKKTKKVNSKRETKSVSNYKLLGFIVCGILVISIGSYIYLYTNFGKKPGTYIISGGKIPSAYGNEINPIQANPELAKAVDLINSLDNEGAIKIIDEEISKEATPELYFNKGIAFINSLKYEDCIAAFTKAIEMKPEDSYAYMNRAYCLASLNKNEEALKDLDKALEINPTDSLLLDRKAMVQKSLK